jgi:integrase
MHGNSAKDLPPFVKPLDGPPNAVTWRAVDWLESGAVIKAVAELLGHSSIAITGDVYGHTSDDTARAAVDGVAGRLGL